MNFLKTLYATLGNFSASEKAVAAAIAAILATIFVFMGKITFPEWENYTLWILGIYTGGKTIQGAAAVISASSPAVPPTDATQKTTTQVNVNLPEVKP